MNITPGQAGKCPHCTLAVRFEAVEIRDYRASMGERNPLKYVSPAGHSLLVDAAACPACGRIILTALEAQAPDLMSRPNAQLWPDTGARPVPPEVEAEASALASDFREAATVFPKSKKASAALSRRCLQFILVHKGAAKSKDLASQIDEVLPGLPMALAQNVDAIRQVGNFAAHPMKAKNSGEIIDVEVGEAEWLLDVLEELFEHYYVAPAQAAERRAALNKKLSDLGKPPLKGIVGPTGP